MRLSMQVCWVYSWGYRRMLWEGRGWYLPQLSVRKTGVMDGHGWWDALHMRIGARGQQRPDLSWFTHPMLALELSRDILSVPCSDDLVPSSPPFHTGVVVF